MFYYPFKESVYIIQYDNVFKYNLSKEITSDSPKIDRRICWISIIIIINL